MTSTTLVDYTSVFEHAELTSIRGRPDFRTLTILFDQLKANAQSVRSLLGGGHHRHFGMVLTPAQYAPLSDVPYVFPPHPGPLQIPAGTAQHEAIRLRAEHEDAIALFREPLDVKQALIKQNCQCP